MSEYKITFEKSAQKFLRKQTIKMQKKILSAIAELPKGKDIKHLKGYDLYRMRIGDIRVIYSVDEVVKIVNIENIDNRGDVYKRY